MYIRIGEVSRLLGVSNSTLRRWDMDNYLTSDYRTRGDHRRYKYKKILQFLGIAKRETKKKEVFIYARVSANKQKEDLRRQISGLEKYALKNNWEITGNYKDIGSGLNDGRKNLLKLIRDIAKSSPDYIICTFKDRVARFGTKLLEEFCQIYDVKLIETEVKVTSEEEKLAHSIIAILTSFSGKLYRSRRGKVTKKPG